MQHSELHIKNMYRCNKTVLKEHYQIININFTPETMYQRRIALRTSQA